MATGVRDMGRRADIGVAVPMDMLSSDSAPRSSIGWLCGVQGAPGAVLGGVVCHRQRSNT
eukprot:scaffold581600_cov30-Prasinocladus_malaysianus.AAC.1